MPPTLNLIISEIARDQDTTVNLKSQLSQGFSNDVYELQPGNHKRYCLRVPKDAGAGRVAARGTDILKILKEKQATLQAPAVIHSSEQYVVLEFLPGQPLGSWNTSVLASKQRQTFLDDLGKFFFNLWRVELDITKRNSKLSTLYLIGCRI